MPELFEVGPAGQIEGAEGAGVVGGHLSVEKGEAAVAEMFEQADEGDFGAVGAAAEHRFPGEEAAYGDPVNAPGQFAFHPTFHAVGVAELVEPVVGLDEVGADPGFLPAGSGFGAGRDDFPEGTVEGDGEATLPEGPFEPAGDVEGIERDDGTGIGGPPGNGMGGPGKNAGAVGEEKAVGMEIASDGHESVPAGPGRVGEPVGVVEDGDGEPHAGRIARKRGVKNEKGLAGRRKVGSVRDVPYNLSTLNPEQLEAVTTVEGPLLVLAGAGTGKTRVITYRMVYLMSLGVDPGSILALTFTNKAAREMKERLADLATGVVDAEAVRKRLVAGTFHSFCVRVLRREIGVLGMGTNFTILDEGDQQGLLKKLITRLGGGKEKLDPRLAGSLISLAKNKGMPIEKVTKDDLVWHVARRYQQELKIQNALDFDDLLVFTLELLRHHPEARQRLRERHRFILVDEYQDTNRLQFDIVKLLASDRHDVCAVGDDDQSIYSWRGAEAGNILEFERHFPNPKIIKLERNYRSTPLILGAANTVILNNARRRAKKLWSEGPAGEKIRVAAAANEAEEAAWVVGDIAEKNARGREWKDFVVLYRMNAQSRSFEQELRRCRIPYRMVGGMSFYERREVKDVLAYLQVMKNPHDDISLLRIINSPPRGIGATTVELLLDQARQHHRPVWDEIERNIAAGGIRSEPLKAFGELMGRYRARLQTGGQRAAVLREFLEEIGYFADLQKSCKEPQEFLNRRENVHELVSALAEFDAAGRGGLAEFIDSMVLEREYDNEKEIKGEGVTLMTLHGAKGLEFPVVYLVGLEEGLLPHERSKMENNVDEERRLLYVGITRAMQELSLSYCLSRKKYGQDEFRRPSSFLEELPSASLVPLAASEIRKPASMEQALDQLAALRARLAAPGV